ncbi:MAG: glycosyltransferase [Bacteroidia bacterium]|nr:glycosyltransferase [Bacteroidia bacterium]MDW8089274.1 glycosyltransferase [Bacteroidia bacterium]
MLPVSVIIPARNEANNLGRLIESLWTQSLPPAEILVVDAGSEDDTAQVAYRLGCRVVQVDRAYPGQARNVGVAYARQEIVAFWDASMWVAPQGLERLVRPILEGRADLVQGRLALRPLSYVSRLSFWTISTLYHVREGEAIYYLPPVACTAFRKVLWEAVGGFPSWRAREDSEFRERLQALPIRICYEPQSLTYWEPAETWTSIGRKLRLYGRHNLLSGKPWNWYRRLAQLYGAYLGVALAVGSTMGWAEGVGALWASMALGGIGRCLRKALTYRQIIKSNFSLDPLEPMHFISGVALILYGDWASFLGVWDWLISDRLGLAPETFPEPQVRVILEP